MEKHYGCNHSKKHFHSLHFADNQFVTAKYDEDIEYRSMTKKLQVKYEAQGLALNLTKTKYL
jgi:hypothetical protein